MEPMVMQQSRGPANLRDSEMRAEIFVPRARAWVAGLALAFSLAGPAAAATWEFSPRVSLTEHWTDNVSLSADGQEDSEWITELRPGFALTGEGARTSVQLDYEAQALWFADNSDFNEVYHDARGNGLFELAPESLFLDAFLRYDQQNIDPGGRVSFSNLFNTDNRTDTFVYGLSPYHVGRWGAWGESLLRLRHQAVRYPDSDSTSLNLQDSDTNSAFFSLGSPQARRGFSWQLNGSTSTTDFDDALDFAYDRVALDLGIPVGLRTRLTATAGQESDVDTDRSAGGLDEAFWFVGVEWQPSELQRLEVRVGDRYYGEAFEVHWSRRGSRGELGLDYTEEPTTSSGVLGDDGVFQPGFRPGGLPALDTRVFLRKRLSGRASYEFVRSSLALRIYADEREFEGDASDTERDYGITLDYDWQLAARMTVGFKADWERRKFASEEREDDLGAVSVRLSRELTRTLSGAFEIGHFFRESDGTFDYDANQASLSVVAQF